MKRLMFLFCVSVMFASAAIADATSTNYCPMETWTGSSFTGYRSKPFTIRYETVCVNGYKFMNTAIIEGEQGIALSTVQMFQNSKGANMPETCACK